MKTNAVPWTIIVGRDAADSPVTYRGETLEGVLAAAISVGPGEEVYISIRLVPSRVNIVRDETALAMDIVPLHVPEPPFGEL